jgi:hypothetical protein
VWALLLLRGGLRATASYPERRVVPTLLTGCSSDTMALPFDLPVNARDPRACAILAKTIFRELRAEGYSPQEVMSVASELLELVASEVKDRRDGPDSARREITSEA